MSVLKCKICGGSLEITGQASVCVCQYCGTKQTLPKLADDHRSSLYERADHFRRSNDFDKAINIYEQILNEDNTDAEAYWSLVLCRYGVEYVEDPKSNNRIATVNRMQYTSVLVDEDYKAAVKYADGEQKAIYEAEAKEIDIIQKGILAISQKESPFDVFICYKETDNNGRRTPDSVLANELYHQLTNEGFKVFFSRITLEDKLGSAYEPYIFAALNSAKVMVVLGTKPEYFNAVWVRNEWSRFLTLIKNGANKVLIPAYRDMDPYNLPEEFSHLQAQDMSKLGFMQDLIRGIQKLTGGAAPKQVAETTRHAEANTADPLLRRVYLFMEDGDWITADEYCEKVLDQNPECAEAYLGKMMVELKIRRRENLQDQAEPFDNNANYKKALRFGDEKLQNELKDANRAIRQRNERTKLLAAYKAAEKLFTSARAKEDYLKAAAAFDAIADFEDSREKAQACREKHDEVHFGGLYAGAVALMNHAKSEEDFLNAGKAFEKIKDYQDSEKLARDCVEKASYTRKNEIYLAAVALMTGNKVSNYKKALTQFEKIPGFKDADMKVEACHERIEQINAAVLAAGVEKQNRAAARAAALKEKLPLIKKVALIVVPVLIVAILAAIILPTIDFSKPEPQGDVIVQSKPATSAPATSTPTSSTPVQTQPPATTVPGTHPLATQPPVTQPPATQPAENQPPVIRPPATTQPPAGTDSSPTNASHADGCPFANGAHADVMALEQGDLVSCEKRMGNNTVEFFHWTRDGYTDSYYYYDTQGNLIRIYESYVDFQRSYMRVKEFDSNRKVTLWHECKLDSRGYAIETTVYDANGKATDAYGYVPDAQGDAKIHYKILSDGTAELTHYNGDDAVVAIPSEANGRVVTKIGVNLFFNKSNLTKVTIPDSVTSIEQGAFWDCINLADVTIGNGVRDVGFEAFANCPKLNYTTYDNAKYLGNATNPYIVLMEVTSKNMSTYNIHKDTKVIYQYAFLECKALINITIPVGVTNIGCGAFLQCESLTSIAIPNTVIVIGASAFEYCKNLLCVTLPDGITDLAGGMFRSCVKLKDVTIPNSVTSIGGSAFEFCYALTKVVIPNKVTIIENYAFAWCNKITEVTIPDSLVSIGEEAFNGSNSIEKVYFSSQAQLEKFKSHFPETAQLIVQ